MLNDYSEFDADVVAESNWPYNHIELGNDEIGNTEIGTIADGEPYHVEIGQEEAILRVIEKARDNRTPPPRMRAVEVDAPLPEEESDWGLTGVFIGAAEVTGNPDPFPLTASFLQRFGASTDPRVVRVDTEESYKAFRAENSPEMMALLERMDGVEERFAEHAADPFAHEVEAAYEDLTLMGEEVRSAEAQKRIELMMPAHFNGLLEAWREGDIVCASIAIPACDGSVRICTGSDSLRKCLDEMARHASEAPVPAAAVVGVLPAMSCVLGAGTIIKEMAAATPEILKRPEMGERMPFEVRIEPKASPALCALAVLAVASRAGNEQAQKEWAALADVSPAHIKQAMGEALALIQRA